ncbi:MAG TPA: hypothetical protein VFR86_18295 [Burkholderiaceae bacterium]|nr:hypothetical protein [Burkholderiaceae bacterium]
MTFGEAMELGRRIAAGKEPASDADRAAWQQGQAKLRTEVTAFAQAVAALPADAPERAAAADELARLSEGLAALELPVLARLDAGMGKRWDLFNSTTRDSEGAALPQRLKLYGLTRANLDEYVRTGQEPAGLQRALGDAQRRGEWPALGVVRAAYMMRADYLRATASPQDAVSLKMAADLDATAKHLSQNRATIHMAWGIRTAAQLLRDHPDPAKRTKHVQQQIDEAKKAIASVRARAVEQVTQNPTRFGKDSVTRTLAADGLATEANIVEAEAKTSMDREAKELAKATETQNKAAKPSDPKLVAPPAKLHIDLAEGGLVDVKRGEAVKIDPRLGDVVRGGDRAVQFARGVIGTQKLRLGNNEQQVAHLKSRQAIAQAAGSSGQRPPAELVAKVNTQLEQLYRSTLETHDKLTREKPGSLSVEQTRLLVELGGDAHVLTSKISTVHHQKNDVEVKQALLHEQKLSAQQMREQVHKQLDAFRKAKIERLREKLNDDMARKPEAFVELQKLDQNPVAYAESQPNTAAEQPRHAELTDALRKLDTVLPALEKEVVNADTESAYMQKVDELDGRSTDAEMAADLAKGALARAETHVAAIPAKGPERLARLQAAADHKAAVIGVATVVRDNADARIARTSLRHQVVETHHRREAAAMGDDPIAHGNAADAIAKSAAAIDKVTADETEVKRGALNDAKGAATATAALRTQIGTELTGARAKPSEVQAYKDALAVRQTRMHGTVAELAADVDPQEAKAQLERAASIIADELPYEHVSRTDKQQSDAQHARNEARGEAQASLGEAGIAVADRASKAGGVDYGVLVVDALGSAHKGAAGVHHTLVIDGGGAAAATADKERHAELRARADGVIAAELEIDRNVNALEVADSIERELGPDIANFNKTYAAMANEIGDRSFGGFLNFVSESMAGFGIYERGLNDEARHTGMTLLNMGASQGRVDAAGLYDLARSIRQMHDAGVPDHVIMAALRDPRLAMSDELRNGFSPDLSPEQRAQWQQGFDRWQTGAAQWRNDVAAAAGRFGATVPMGLFENAIHVRTRTPLGRALEAAPSNGTNDIVSYISHQNTDLLAGAQARLHESYADSTDNWAEFKSYAAFGQVLDQVLLTVASSVTFAGVFARVAAATTIPQKFAAARAIAQTMSAPAKAAMLLGINAAETGLGMLTGAAITKVGNGIFGEGSGAAKVFAAVGGGLQLHVGAAVAMRTGIGFQTTLGVTMGSAPIVAEELGASPALAEKLGMAVAFFVPTVLGTISNYRNVPRATGVMIHELGIDPGRARAAAAEVMRSFGGESRFAAAGSAGGLVREHTGRLVDAQFKDLSADARTKLADTLTLDAARSRVGLNVPENGTPEIYVREVESYYKRLETELVKQGVQADRAHELVNGEKTAMYAEALASTNGLLAGANPAAHAPDVHKAGGAGAATRQTAERLAQEVQQPQSRSVPPGAPGSFRAMLVDEIAQIGGIPRDIIKAQEMWSSLPTVKDRVDFLRDTLNLRLQQHGIPELSVVVLQNAGDTNGQYTIRQHEIAIREEFLRRPELSRQDVIQLSDLVRHEVEHAVQWVDMARVLAARGADVDQITTAMGRGTSLQVSERVAKWAVAEQAAGRGIDLASPRAALADFNYSSVYGLRKNFEGMTRRQVLNELHEASQELALREAAYQQQKNTPGKDTALAEWGAALRRHQDAMHAYQSLSEEHGAHVAGRMAEVEAEQLTDPKKSPGAFANAPTQVFDGTRRPATPADLAIEAAAERDSARPQQSIHNAPTAPHRAVEPAAGESIHDAPTARHRAVEAAAGESVHDAPTGRNRAVEPAAAESVHDREYQRRYEQARRWVSDQMIGQSMSANGGASLNIAALQERAAALFGLDRHWPKHAGSPPSANGARNASAPQSAGGPQNINAKAGPGGTTVDITTGARDPARVQREAARVKREERLAKRREDTARRLESINAAKDDIARTMPGPKESITAERALQGMEQHHWPTVASMNGRRHAEAWREAGNAGEPPIAFRDGNVVRIDLQRLTPEQHRRFREHATYVPPAPANKTEVHAAGPTPQALTPSQLNGSTQAHLRPSQLNGSTQSHLRPSQLNEATEPHLRPSQLNEPTEPHLRPSQLSRTTRSW